MPAANATLYAWVVPAFVTGSPVDHTWVTSFDNRRSHYPKIADVVAAKESCWFCWGSYHPAGAIPGNPDGALGSRRASLSLASCLVTPNADSRTVAGARGTIFKYGLDGVCHQLANQVLYATGTGRTQPMTVQGARGYIASTFVYGTYGLQHSAWAAKIASCGAATKAFPPSGVWTGAGGGQGPGGGDGDAPMDEPDDFTRRASEVLANEPETLSRLLALKGEVQMYAAQRMPTSLAPPADFLNARNQQLIDEAGRLLGDDSFEKIFGFRKDERINLVDPTLYSIEE